MSSYYTLAVRWTVDGELVREIVDPKFAMPFHIADTWAAELNAKYANPEHPELARTYDAVNVNSLIVAQDTPRFAPPAEMVGGAHRT